MYVMQILFSVLMATMLASFIPRAAASAARIQEVLDVEPGIGDPEKAGRPEQRPRVRPEGLVEFKDVEFRYPGAEEAVLSNISFTARPGRPRPSSAARAAASRPSSASSRACTTSPRAPSTIDGRRHPGDGAGRAVEAHRLRAAEGLPLLGHRGQQPPLRRRGGHR